MEIVYKIFEIAIGLFFIFMIVRYLRCVYGNCNLK